MLSAAGGDLHRIGTAVSVGNAVAAGPLTGVVPAAEEVSALSAAQFAAYAQMYQDFSALGGGDPRAVCSHLSERSYRGDQLSRAAEQMSRRQRRGCSAQSRPRWSRSM
jgi:PE family